MARVRHLFAMEDVRWQTAVARVVSTSRLLLDLSAEFIHFLIIINGTLPIILESILVAIFLYIALILQV